jgi:PAS domain S-box-containing protein
MARYEAQIQQNESELTTHLDVLQGTLSQSELDQLAEFRNAWERYGSIRDGQLLPASRTSKQAALALVGEGVAAGDTIHAALNALQGLHQAHAASTDRTLALTRQRYTRGQSILLFFTVLTIIAPLVFGIRWSAQLANNVQSVLDAAQLMAAGDLDWRITVRSGDELESVAEALNRIARNMKKLLAAKAEVTDQVQREANELKQTKLALAAEEKRLAATLRLTDNIVVSADSTGRITALSKAAQEYFGWGEGEALGQPLEQICPIINAQTRERYDKWTQRVIESGGLLGFPGQTMLIAKDGTEHQVAIGSAAIHDPEGNVIGAVFIFRDAVAEETADAAQTQTVV